MTDRLICAKLCLLKVHNKSEDNSLETRILLRGKMLGLLGRREYSVQELKKKILEKFPEESLLIEEVLLECQRKNWVSDVRYANEFIREKSEYGGWGPMKITQKLREKGIESSLIESSLEAEFPEDKQRILLQELAEKKWKLLYKKTAADRKGAVQRFLLSRGFSFQLVLEVTQSLNREEIN